MVDDRLQRLARIASAIEAEEQPHPRDTRPHRLGNCYLVM